MTIPTQTRSVPRAVVGGSIDCRRALLCANVFLGLATLTLVAGAFFGAFALMSGVRSGDSEMFGLSAAVSVWIVVAAIASAASTAFFGYVIKLLAGIYAEVRAARHENRG